jgi:Flp pilus assembly protein TadG
MKNQKGVSMVGLIIILVVLVLCAGLGMKVGPAYMEYLQIKKAVAAIVESGEVRQGSVADVRKAFDKRAQVDAINAITSQDLDISKDGGNLVISFAYPQKVPLVGNVSLLFDFAGSSKK